MCGRYIPLGFKEKDEYGIYKQINDKYSEWENHIRNYTMKQIEVGDEDFRNWCEIKQRDARIRMDLEKSITLPAYLVLWEFYTKMLEKVGIPDMSFWWIGILGLLAIVVLSTFFLHASMKKYAFWSDLVRVLEKDEKIDG